MKKAPLYLVLLFLAKSAFAQFTSHAGTIFFNGADSLNGTIHISGLRPSATECRFQQKGGTIYVYKPDEIMGFQIPGSGTFLSKEVPEEGSMHKYFLEYLVDGQASLYYLRTPSGNRYFMEKDTLFIELDNKERETVSSNGTRSRSHSKRYVGQLKYAMQDTPELYIKIEQIDFQADDLVELTTDYHQLVCQDEDCIVYWKTVKASVRISPLAGWYFSRFGLPNTESTIQENGIHGGLQFEFQSPFISPKIYISTGLFLSQPHFEGLIPDADYYYNIPYDLDVDMKFSLLKVPLIFSYLPLNGKFKMGLGAGLSANVSLFPDNKVELLFAFGETYLDSHISSFQFGYLGTLIMEYEFNDVTSIRMMVSYENRHPLKNLGRLTDDHFIRSIYLDAGVSFRIR